MDYIQKGIRNTVRCITCIRTVINEYLVNCKVYDHVICFETCTACGSLNTFSFDWP